MKNSDQTAKKAKSMNNGCGQEYIIDKGTSIRKVKNTKGLTIQTAATVEQTQSSSSSTSSSSSSSNSSSSNSSPQSTHSPQIPSPITSHASTTCKLQNFLDVNLGNLDLNFNLILF